jgi:hypothetical protein
MVYLSEQQLKEMHEKQAQVARIEESKSQGIPVSPKVETAEDGSPTMGVVIPTTLKPWDLFTKQFVEDLLSIDIPVCLVLNHVVTKDIPAFPSGVVVTRDLEPKFNFPRLNNVGKKALLKEFPTIKWVIYANDDMVFYNNSAKEALKHFSPPEEFRDHKVFSGMIYDMNGTIQRCGGKMVEGGSQSLQEHPQTSTHYALMGGPFHIASVSHSWDENLPGHLNDDDFSLRGGGTVVIPEIKLKHQQNFTLGGGSFAAQKDWRYFHRAHHREFFRVFSKLNLPAGIRLITPPHADDIDELVLLQTDHIGDHAFAHDAKTRLIQRIRKPVVCLGGKFIKSLLIPKLLENTVGIPISFIQLDYRDEGGCKANIHPVPPEQLQIVNSMVSKNSLLVNFRIDGSDQPLFSKIPHKYLCAIGKGDFSVSFDPKIPVTTTNNLLAASIPEYIPLHPNYKKGGFGGVVFAPFASIPSKEVPIVLYARIVSKLLDFFDVPVYCIAHGSDRSRIGSGSFQSKLLPDLPLVDLMELICEKRLWYIGNDSGPSHWAVRSGIPTIIVHPPQTNPIMLSVPTSHLLFIHPTRSFGDINEGVFLKAFGELFFKVETKILFESSTLGGEIYE